MEFTSECEIMVKISGLKDNLIQSSNKEFEAYISLDNDRICKENTDVKIVESVIERDGGEVIMHVLVGFQV